MTKKHKFIVRTNAVDGIHAAFNEWYDKTHLRVVLKVQEYISAQRFSAVASLTADYFYHYCAGCEVESDKPKAAIKKLLAVSETNQMVMSDALQPQFCAMLYEAVGNAVFA